MSERITLYAGSFGANSSIQDMVDEANAIAASDFNVVLLSFVNVDDEDNLVFNGYFPELNPTLTPLISPLVKDIFAFMKAGTSMTYTNGQIVADQKGVGPAKKLLFSIGGWTWAQSVFRIYSPSSNGPLYPKFKTIADAYHIDGYDFDYEPPYIYGKTLEEVYKQLPYYSNTANPNRQKGIDTSIQGFDTTMDYTMLADVMQGFLNQDSSWEITAAPFEEPSWWGEVVTAVPSISWFNVQFYSGTNNESPSDWASNLESWIQGTAMSADRLDPGPNADPNGTPQYDASTMQTAVANAKGSYSINGAFVWRYTFIKGNMSGWASAMKNGLATRTVPPKSS